MRCITAIFFTVGQAARVCFIDCRFSYNLTAALSCYFFQFPVFHLSDLHVAFLLLVIDCIMRCITAIFFTVGQTARVCFIDCRFSYNLTAALSCYFFQFPVFHLSDLHVAFLLLVIDCIMRCITAIFFTVGQTARICFIDCRFPYNLTAALSCYFFQFLVFHLSDLHVAFLLLVIDCIMRCITAIFFTVGQAARVCFIDCRFPYNLTAALSCNLF